MSHEDMEIEILLARYRPAGPPARLRDRILATTGPRRSPWTVVGRLSLATMLILCVGLHLSAERVARQTSAVLNPEPTKWTAQAEEAIELLNGQGRRYIALALAADEPRIARLLREKAPVSLFKDIP